MDEKKRLTLDLDASLQRRLKARAALKGESMRDYCERAIERALEQDELVARSLRFGPESVERLRKLREEMFHGKPISPDSVTVLREAREIRDRELAERGQ